MNFKMAELLTLVDGSFSVFIAITRLDKPNQSVSCGFDLYSAFLIQGFIRKSQRRLDDDCVTGFLSAFSISKPLFSTFMGDNTDNG